ncbi:hypothetical protein CPB84DRAFT_787041 [Gymnopilus junonius]|uniref:Uncharacterized protein n=1 Tax=Gymnopilus junonius TaxID=109634 RepID=A0A9P5NQY5_GYMJU|nr:hypothetical protein CPB84DRAFT_787041 [Gymnopilus junonius]
MRKRREEEGHGRRQQCRDGMVTSERGVIQPTAQRCNVGTVVRGDRAVGGKGKPKLKLKLNKLNLNSDSPLKVKARGCPKKLIAINRLSKTVVWDQKPRKKKSIIIQPITPNETIEKIEEPQGKAERRERKKKGKNNTLLEYASVICSSCPL